MTTLDPRSLTLFEGGRERSGSNQVLSSRVALATTTASWGLAFCFVMAPLPLLSLLGRVAWWRPLLGRGRGRLVRPLPCLGGAALGALAPSPSCRWGPCLGAPPVGGGSRPFPLFGVQAQCSCKSLSGAATLAQGLQPLFPSSLRKRFEFNLSSPNKLASDPSRSEPRWSIISC